MDLLNFAFTSSPILISIDYSEEVGEIILVVDVVLEK